MKWALFLLVILLTVVSVAQITPEEKLIRETYAKIELATQINYVQQALTDVNSKLPLPELLKQNRLEFRLSDFHVGDLADVLKEPYGTFITRPVGQDNLQITKGIFNAQRGQNAYRNVYATVEWVHNRMVAPVEWDTMLVGHVLDATQMSENSTYSRYASYTISVTFQGKTQTRRATWFYGKDKEGEAIVLTGDHLTGSAAVNAFVHQPIYPAALLEDPSTRSKPAVEEWLRTVAQDCPGNRRDNCYDETTGKAGISRQDIYKQTSSFKRYQTGQSCKGGDTCDLYSFVTSATRVVP